MNGYVWLVWYFTGSEQDLVGVYGTKELAEQRVKTRGSFEHPSDFAIEEKEIIND